MLKLIVPFIFFNLFLIVIFTKFKNKFKIIDNPDKEKKIHKSISYPIGGIFIYLSLIIFISLESIISTNLFSEYELTKFNKIYFFFFMTLFFLIGLIDDKFNLKPTIRLILLFIIVLIFLQYLQDFKVYRIYFKSIDFLLVLNSFSFLFTAISIILLIQILNFFDGIDLQLSLYAIFIFIYLFVITESLVLIFLIITLLFNLYLNKYQKIFLGDGGVYLISFLISCLIIFNYNKNILIAEQIFIILLIPFLDFFRLFFERLMARKNPMKGDLGHIHHLIIKNLGLSKTLIIVNLLYLSPSILYYFFDQNFEFISGFSIISYFLIIFYFKSKKTNF